MGGGNLEDVVGGVEQVVEPVNQEEFYDVLHAPYVKGFSEGLQRKLRRFKVGYVPKKGKTFYTHLCKLKQKVELEDRKNVIYAVECETCGVQYVGETGQHYCDQRKQHQGDVKTKKTTNGISEHLRRNLEHKINWDNWKGRKMKEAMYSNALNPSVTMNTSRIMNLEKGFEFDSIWSEFNSVSRSSLKSKWKSNFDFLNSYCYSMSRCYWLCQSHL